MKLPHLLSTLLFVLLLAISISLIAQPQNDEPCTATPIDIYNGCFDEYYTTIGATLTPSSSAPNPSCGSYTSSDGDVWFSFTMPPSGNVSFDMDGVNIDLAYDESDDMGAAVYSGANCSSLSQVTCSYNIFGPPSFSANGIPGNTYYLRVWYFELGSTGAGIFEICANGGNGATPVPPNPPLPPCASNPAPSDDCASAPLISNLNGYCGSTGNYTDGPNFEPSSANDLFCGSTENSSWLSFIAADNTATFHVYLSGCSGRFQARIFEVTNCNTFVPVSNCLESTASPSYLFASGLVPGNVYHIFMDGYTGSSCDYTIGGTSGVQIPCDADTTLVNGMSCAPADTGTFIENLTNAGGCDSLIITSIGLALQFSNSLTISDENCDLANGSITTNPSGGFPPYNFNWSDGSQASNRTGLSAGTYIVTISDGFSCDRIDTAIIANLPGNLALSLSPTSASCLNATDGSIDLSIQTGTGSFDYNWSNGSIMQDPTGLSPGTYIVTTTDGAGCSLVDSAVVSINSTTSLSATSDSSSCFGSTDGSATVLVNNGNPPFSYLWSNNQTTMTAAGLSAAVYSVTVTDATNCEFSTSVTVLQPAPIVETATTDSVSCAGRSDGAIDLTVSGGTAPYSFNWSNGTNNEDPSGLSTGSYQVTVSDANSCSVSASYGIFELPALTVIFSTTDAGCFQVADGSIASIINGGTSPYQFNWNNGQQSQTAQSLLPGRYILTITDANNCSITDSARIRGDAEMETLISANDASCATSASGSIDLEVAVGVSPFSYIWSNGAIVQDPSGLLPGFYEVTVTDNNSCTTYDSVTVGQTLNLSLSLSADSVSCFGGTNGSASATASSGTAPYSFVWSSGSSSSTASNLSAGKYLVTVTDAGLCEVVDSVEVFSPSQLMAGLSPEPVSCFGGTDGGVDLSPTGGSGSYTFSWSNGATTEDISNLAAGNYNLSLMDANLCMLVGAVQVTQSGPISINFQLNDPQCFQSADGFIATTINGGTAPFQYNWSTGSQNQNLSAILAGTYILTVTDSNLCTTIDSAVLTDPAALQSALVATDASCFGSADGSVDLTMTAGMPPYTFSWSNGAIIEDPSGLSAGLHIVTITDAGLCSLIDSVVIAEPTELNLVLAGSGVSCAGGSNGQANAAVSGGSGPYSFSWSNNQSGTIATGLTAGTYRLTVTDGNGCIAIDSIQIPEPPPLNAQILISGVSCSGGTDGSADLSISGGVPPYTQIWSTGLQTEDIDSLSAGNYEVIITDGLNCILRDTAVITDPLPITSSILVTDIPCFSGSNGIADLTANGGSGSLTFLWSSGDTTEDVNTFSAGTHTVSITDDNGCLTVDTAIVNQAGTPSTSILATHATCFGFSDGELDLTVSSGSVPYTFVWSNNAITEDQSGLVAGEYYLTVSDTNNCVVFDTALISEPAQLQISISSSAVSCFGLIDGSAAAQVFGGTRPYNYIWSNGSNDSTAALLASGNVFVTVSDANGCIDSAATSITQPDSISLSAQTSNVSCSGISDGSITINVSGGSGTFSYSWSNGAISDNIDSLSPGIYDLTTTDSNGCTATFTDEIFDHAPLILDVLTDSTSCFGDQGNDGTAAILVQVDQDHRPLSYAINGSPLATDSFFTNLSPGNYLVEVIDAEGCSDTIGFDIYEPEQITATATADTTTVLEGGSAQLGVTVTPAANYNYSWLPANSLNCDSCASPVASPDDEITYQIIVEDESGCSDIDSITIRVIFIEGLFVPNAFTPNSDGVNDGWQVFGERIDRFEVKVFNRIGELVFRSNDPLTPWDGTYKGEKVRPGAYAYYVEGSFISGNRFERKGSVTLVR